jgi:DNA-binding transcriptional MerR regulator
MALSVLNWRYLNRAGDMGNSDLTPGQVAALLGTAPSTLRLWSVKFGRHLSPTAQAGHGARRHYTPDDLSVLERARGLLAEGRPFEDVDRLLGVAPEAAQPTGGALVTLPKIAAELSQAIDLIRQLSLQAQAQQAEIDRLREAQAQEAEHHAGALATAQAEHAQAIESTRHEVARIVDRQHTKYKAHEAEIAALRAELDRVKAEQEAARRSWLDRLLGRK